MYRFQRMKKSLLRVAVVTVLGIVVALGNPFTVDAKAKISKPALQEMIAGAKTAAVGKRLAREELAGVALPVPDAALVVAGVACDVLKRAACRHANASTLDRGKSP